MRRIIGRRKGWQGVEIILPKLGKMSRGFSIGIAQDLQINYFTKAFSEQNLKILQTVKMNTLLKRLKIFVQTYLHLYQILSHI